MAKKKTKKSEINHHKQATRSEIELNRAKRWLRNNHPDTELSPPKHISDMIETQHENLIDDLEKYVSKTKHL